jgi:hypothetical protein
MGEKGRACVQARYDRRRLADEYLEILRETVEEKHRERAA